MKSKSRNIGIRKIITWTLSVVALLVSIGFVETSQPQVQVTKINITVHDQGGDYFLTDKDIMLLMTDNGLDPIMGVAYRDLNLRAVEERVEMHKFVRYAEVSKDLQGTLQVDAWQARPIARIVRPDGVDAYISEEGVILPVLERYTARTMLVSGPLASTLMKADLGKDHYPELLHLLQVLEADEFWRAQIAQLEIEEDQEIVMYPQVTRQRVEFGTPTEVDTKLNKLRIFYQRILPAKGWNTYERVNLKYKDQIICE